VFDVVAESKEDARLKVLQDCGLVIGGSIHSTLHDEEINWAFSTHPEVRTGRIQIKKKKWGKGGGNFARPILSFVSLSG